MRTGAAVRRGVECECVYGAWRFRGTYTSLWPPVTDAPRLVRGPVASGQRVTKCSRQPRQERPKIPRHAQDNKDTLKNAPRLFFNTTETTESQSAIRDTTAAANCHPGHRAVDLGTAAGQVCGGRGAQRVLEHRDAETVHGGTPGMGTQWRTTGGRGGRPSTKFIFLRVLPHTHTHARTYGRR